MYKRALTTVLYNCKAPFTLEIYFEICERGLTVFNRVKLAHFNSKLRTIHVDIDLPPLRVFGRLLLRH